jgi:hypothetical protein
MFQGYLAGEEARKFYSLCYSMGLSGEFEQMKIWGAEWIGMDYVRETWE